MAQYQKRVVALNKQRIIEHILTGKTRGELPAQLNNALGTYTKPSSQCVDADFNKKVRELAPHYFREHLCVPKKKTPAAVVAQATAFVANAAQQTKFTTPFTPVPEPDPVATKPKRVRKPSKAIPVAIEPPGNALSGVSSLLSEAPCASEQPAKRKSIWEKIGSCF